MCNLQKELTRCDSIGKIVTPSVLESNLNYTKPKFLDIGQASRAGQEKKTVAGCTVCPSDIGRKLMQKRTSRA